MTTLAFEPLALPQLSALARRIRAHTIVNSHQTQTPHLGSCLSCIDILVAAYFGVLRIDPKHPRHPERDRFILSKGHGAPALFQTLAQRGF
jgi:transketolase